MRRFETRTLPKNPDTLAPDGAKVRLLGALEGGSFAHFELPASAISLAVKHCSVEEIWFVLEGRGRIWRRGATQESIDDIAGGDCLTVPLGVEFQYRASNETPLTFVAVTMPPWPGAQEAVFVEGPWQAGLRDS
jgi:mannose-6-phosphate isomerase-like protein (cupin superfamily)